LTAAEEVVDLLADVASTTDREAAIKRAFVLGGEKVFDASVDQARDLLDDLVLSRLPEDLKNQANQKIDEAIGNLKPKVLDAAEVVGELYADGSQQIGGWIGNSLFELYDQWQVLFEDEYQKNLPNQSPLQDVQQGFDIEQIIIDSKYIPEPLLTPRPQQPDLVEPEEGPQIIQLNLSLDTTIKGTLEELDGDVVYDFFLGDRIILENVTLSPDSVTVRYSSAILEIDADLDGFTESTITLEGDFDSIEFSIEQVGPDTVIRPFSVNGSPSAIDDTILVSEDQSVSGNVLEDNGNGIDRDPDGDDLTVSLVSGPSEGSLILNDDGSFTYEADADVFDLAAPGEVIDQTFTYQIDDGNGETDQATVTIFVAIQDDGQTIVGMNKKDTLNGTDGGEDIIYGNNAKDMIYGLDGADTIYGGNADDMLFGGESADSLFGERGDDQLFGEQGEDYLDGGRGSDVLRGGFDDDTLLGGRGDDVFVLGLGEGTDTILDYGVGEDFIGLVGLTFDDLTFGQSGDNATISSGGEVLATLIGVNSLTLDETDVFNFI